MKQALYGMYDRSECVERVNAFVADTGWPQTASADCLGLAGAAKRVAVALDVGHLHALVAADLIDEADEFQRLGRDRSPTSPRPRRPA